MQEINNIHNKPSAWQNDSLGPLKRSLFDYFTYSRFVYLTYKPGAVTQTKKECTTVDLIAISDNSDTSMKFNQTNFKVSMNRFKIKQNKGFAVRPGSGRTTHSNILQ